MSMCRILSCVIGRGGLLWPVCALDKTLLTFALLHFVLQGQICLLLQVSLDFLLLHSSPPMTKRTSFLGVSSRRSYRVLIEPFKFLGISGWGIDLDYCDTEWLALEMNRDHCHFWDCTHVMLKILQARLQQYMNNEMPDVQAGFRKGRGTINQNVKVCWIMEKAREFQKNI